VNVKLAITLLHPESDLHFAILVQERQIDAFSGPAMEDDETKTAA